MNIIFVLTSAYDFMHFQFKLGAFKKNTWNEKIVKYRKLSYNCVKFEHVLSRDVFEGKRNLEMNGITFC